MNGNSKNLIGYRHGYKKPRRTPRERNNNKSTRYLHNIIVSIAEPVDCHSLYAEVEESFLKTNSSTRRRRRGLVVVFPLTQFTRRAGKVSSERAGRNIHPPPGRSFAEHSTTSRKPYDVRISFVPVRSRPPKPDGTRDDPVAESKRMRKIGPTVKYIYIVLLSDRDAPFVV